MKSLRLLLAVLSLLLAPRALAETVMYAPLPPSKDLYSFADLYRLATGAADLPPAMGAGPAQPTAAQQLQIRTVAGEAPAATQPASPYVFSIDRAAAPGGGPLFLAGLAAALWVARRRLGYAIRG
jgi:hypothetical protein